MKYFNELDMTDQFIIPKKIANKILMIGVSKSTYGGMTAVLVSYEKYFEKSRFIPTWRLGNKFVKAFYAFQAVMRCFLLLLVDQRIKVLHIHGAANASFYRKRIFIKIGKFFRKKVIMHQHAADFEEFFENSHDKPNIVRTLNLCDTLIVLSQSWEKYFASIGVREANIRVLNNMVTPPTGSPEQRSDDKLHLLFLGEISNRKGIYDVLTMLKDNKEFFQNRLLLRIGGNAVDGDIHTFINKNALSRFVKYEGWVSGEKKADCFAWADVYILPSYNEGLPVAILEAMSYARPVISTNVGGIPEIVYSYENGILIEAGNLEQIKEAVQFFIDHPALLPEYGRKCFETVRPFFPESVCKQLTSIYEDLLRDKT